MEPLMSMIMFLGASYAPKYWLNCLGQLVSIAENSALFSLMGTTYGGDGVSVFALPDLRGRAPIGQGLYSEPGFNDINFNLGQTGGFSHITLTTDHLPTHNHPAGAGLIVSPSATIAAGTTNIPGPTLVPSMLPTIGGGPSATPVKGYGVKNDSTTLAPQNVSGFVGSAGGNQPFDSRNPYLVVNYVIAMQGIYPSRN